MSIHTLLKTFFSIIAVFVFVEIKGQHYHFDNYSVQQGLAQSSVYSMAQGEDGVLWIGTKSGVSKFDGKEFVNYSSEDGLADGTVRKVYIDSIGTIWLGHNNGGISRFSGGKFESVNNIDGDVASFSEDGKGNLWVSSYGSGAVKITNPYVSDITTLKFQQIEGEGVGDIVLQVLIRKNGTVFFVTKVGVKYYDEVKDTFLFYKKIPAYFPITCIYESRNEDLWFGTYNGGLYKYDEQRDKVFTYDIKDGLASNWVSSIIESSNGDMWIGTWGDEDGDNGGVTRIRKGEFLTINREKGFAADIIRCLLEDREGNIILGTRDNGFFVYKNAQLLSYDTDNGLIDPQVTAILVDSEGKSWFGTNKGISLFKANQFLKHYTKKEGLENEKIKFIKEDAQKNIWIGTEGGGVIRFDSKTERFDASDVINKRMSQPLIQAMEIDAFNNLWVGTTDGLIRYEINTSNIERISTGDGLAGNEISSIYADSKNVLWVGSLGKGLTKIEKGAISITNFPKTESPASIVEDTQGNLWVGTQSRGVILFKDNQVVKEFTTKDGLLSNYISLLNIDDEGHVWVGTNKGLNQYLPDQNKFYSYSEKLGYVGIESKKNATFKDQNGNLWFGTVEGAIKMDINEPADSGIEPLTRITSWMVNGENMELKEGIELDYKQKSIRFNFNSICLTDPDEVYYRVMLEGLDKEWGPITKQNFFSNTLDPGDYTFKVIASNNNGVWNKEPATFSFGIEPPWWKKPFVWVMGALFILVLIAAYVKYREKKLIVEKKVLEEKVELRTEELMQKSVELEKKNKDIIDSITYAKRIQEAILPTDETVISHLHDTFVLFEPKDIVSGDFYWVTTKNKKSLFAAVDCTGHGVPGAFMSIVGHDLLDKIVGEYNITTPSEILDELNKGVTKGLKQEGNNTEGVKDGMDISLCSFDPDSGILEYSGAYNPLYVVTRNRPDFITGGEVEPNMVDGTGLMLFEIKADRFAIGNYSERVAKFTNHSIKLNKGDVVYLFSDGYADQFGGEKGKKFRYKQFKQLLLKINDKSMAEQRDHMKKTMKEWKGDLEQIDDIVIIGSKW